MTNNKKDPLWQEVWDELGGVCVMCLKYPASSVHEIVPRSKLPNSALLDKDNRVTLCTNCHHRIEQEGSGKYIQLLKDRRAMVKELFSE